MLGHLRPYMGHLKRLLAWPYLRLGLTANQVGLVGVILAALAAALIRWDYRLPAFWIAMVAVLSDMADGEVARQTDSETPQGNYLDAMGDRMREGLLMLGLVPFAPDLLGLALLGTCLTSFAKARCALVVVMDNRDWPGLGDHADRAVILLFAYLLVPQGVQWPLWLLVVATWTCCAGRMKRALELIEKGKEDNLLPYLRASERYQR